MIKNNLIVIPFNLPWEWSTDYTNQTAFILCKHNTVICYMWGESFSLKEYLIDKHKLPKPVTKYSRNIYLFYPIQWIPMRRFLWVTKINEKINIYLLKLMISYLNITKMFRKKIIWIFDPNMRFINDFFAKNWIRVFDCVDYFTATTNDLNKKEKIRANEEKLAKESDLVTSISKINQEYLQSYRKDIYLVPQGFRIQDFGKKTYNAPKIDLPHPIIGFVGAVNFRLDYDLLLPLAKKRTDWSFVVWGPVLEKEKFNKKNLIKMQSLLSLPNVTTGFLKDRKELPGVLKQFDIAMIPYDIKQDFNKYCYPMKLIEFFYIGLPVVSTAIEELKRFPKFIKIGKNSEEWETIIERLLSNNWPKNLQQQERSFAAANSWLSKIDKITKLLSKMKLLD